MGSSPWPDWTSIALAYSHPLYNDSTLTLRVQLPWQMCTKCFPHAFCPLQMFRAGNKSRQQVGMAICRPWARAQSPKVRPPKCQSQSAGLQRPAALMLAQTLPAPQQFPGEGSGQLSLQGEGASRTVPKTCRGAEQQVSSPGRPWDPAACAGRDRAAHGASAFASLRVATGQSLPVPAEPAHAVPIRLGQGKNPALLPVLWLL